MAENLTTVYRLVRLRSEDVRPFAQVSKETKIPIGHLVRLAMQAWQPKDSYLRDELDTARRAAKK